MATKQHPTVIGKLAQLTRVVHESHRAPLAGYTQPPRIVSPKELGITFIGHSSFFIQIAGRNILIDPVFARSLVVLRRQRRAGTRIADLPPIDAVLLSHAHMDHLNLPSLRRIVRHTRRLTGNTPAVIVPRGVGDLVNRLGFRQVTELEWWNSVTFDENDNVGALSQPKQSKAKKHGRSLIITLTPCKHWGARMFSDTHRLYGGYVLTGAGHSVYHSGDTAYFNGFHEIGQRLQPKTALLPIGAYFPDSYRAVHTSPEEALQAFRDLGTATTMIPMHYGTFPLGREPMEEPPLRLMEAAEKAGIADLILILPEGETYLKPPVRQSHEPHPQARS